MINVTTNAAAIAKEFDDIGRQLPYATAVALTKTAQEIQKKTIDTLPQKFTLRTTWYKAGPYAFKITPATKTRLEAEVYTTAPFMQLQETGGVKVTHKGKKYLAIPTDHARPNKNKVIPQNLRPKFLLEGYKAHGASKKKGHGAYVEFGKAVSFIGTIKGHFGIWTRTGKNELMLMYNLRSSAEIHPRLYFEQTAERIIAERFPAIFREELEKAIASAK